MFKIRNGMPGNLTIDLEQGSVTLRPGKSFDLEGDGKCSRKWISKNSLLKRWLNEGKIVILMDTGDTDIPSVPTSYVVGKVKSPKKKKKVKPQIIDFGKGEDLDDKGQKVEAPQEESPDYSEVTSFEPEKKKMEEPDPLPSMGMYKAELVEWAQAAGLDVDEKNMTKSEILSLIESTEAYKNLEAAWEVYKD